MGIRQKFEKAANFGELVEIREGLYYTKIPLPLALDHVNVYIAHDDDGVTIVDTGLNTEKARATWKQVIEKYIAPRPIKRVIVTHFHPDHMGLAGWFYEEFGAEIITNRMSFILARMLFLDREDRPDEILLSYWRNAGMPLEEYERRRQDRPFNFSDSVMSMNFPYKNLYEGDEITLAGEPYEVKYAYGHAPQQITLWGAHEIFGADQMLEKITPNIGVYRLEPDENALKEFFKSCNELLEFADDERLILTGHYRPYFGGKTRLLQLIEHHENALVRLRRALVNPYLGFDLFEPLFERPIPFSQWGFAMAETLAHLNYLKANDELSLSLDEHGRTLWQLKNQ